MGDMALTGIDTTVAMKKAKVYRGTIARPNKAPTITKSKFLATTRAPPFSKENRLYSMNGARSSLNSGLASVARVLQASASIMKTAAA